MNTLFFLLCALLLIPLSPGTARPDWEGKMRVLLPRQKGGASQIEGQVRAQNNRQRVDLDGGMPISTIIDLRSGKAWNLLHGQKMVMEMELSQVSTYIPHCKPSSIDSCLAKKGFQKTGTESLDGEPCDLYQAKGKENGKPVTVKLWRPKRLKEVPALRALQTDDAGVLVDMRILEIKTRKQKSGLFSVPKDYKSMGSIGDVFKSLSKHPKSG